jgi:hypothetical protein
MVAGRSDGQAEIAVVVVVVHVGQSSSRAPNIVIAPTIATTS